MNIKLIVTIYRAANCTLLSPSSQFLEGLLMVSNLVSGCVMCVLEVMMEDRVPSSSSELLADVLFFFIRENTLSSQALEWGIVRIAVSTLSN